ncbi:MAG: hypothetical protein WC755_01515 [Candidatus Woesearchaeota archaeon]|jgi:hypothetical protein
MSTATMAPKKNTNLFSSFIGFFSPSDNEFVSLKDITAIVPGLKEKTDLLSEILPVLEEMNSLYADTRLSEQKIKIEEILITNQRFFPDNTRKRKIAQKINRILFILSNYELKLMASKKDLQNLASYFIKKYKEVEKE